MKRRWYADLRRAANPAVLRVSEAGGPVAEVQVGNAIVTAWESEATLVFSDEMTDLVHRARCRVEALLLPNEAVAYEIYSSNGVQSGWLRRGDTLHVHNEVVFDRNGRVLARVERLATLIYSAP